MPYLTLARQLIHLISCQSGSGHRIGFSTPWFLPWSLLNPYHFILDRLPSSTPPPHLANYLLASLYLLILVGSFFFTPFPLLIRLLFFLLSFFLIAPSQPGVVALLYCFVSSLLITSLDRYSSLPTSPPASLLHVLLDQSSTSRPFICFLPEFLGVL